MDTDLPPRLRELLTHEAYFQMGRMALVEAAEGMRAEHAAAKKSSTGILRWLNHNDEAQREQMTALEGELKHIETAIRKADNMGPALLKELLRTMEDHLRDQDPDYRKGLATQSLVTDWERGIWLIRERLQELRKNIGTTRNAMCACYDRDRKSFSDSALRALGATVSQGAKLEQELHTLNALRSDYIREAERIEWTPHTLLPEIDVPDFSQRLATIADMEAAQAQQHFHTILEDCERFSQKAFTAWEKGLERVRISFEDSRQSYLETWWQKAQAYAREHWVDPARLLEGLAAAEQAMEGFEGFLIRS